MPGADVGEGLLPVQVDDARLLAQTDLSRRRAKRDEALSHARLAVELDGNEPAHHTTLAIAELLKAEGYVEDVATAETGPGKKVLSVKLKYFQGKPVIEKLERVSRPGLRKYRGNDALPSVLGGLGIAIVSTSKGLMTDAKARSEGLGGEVLCLVA